MKHLINWLKDFSHRRSRYQRPVDGWVCGHASEGWSCPNGPTASGKCGATAECVPGKKGERWQCTRSELHGGKCESGPDPEGKCAHPVVTCQPVPSLRRRRGQIVAFAVATVVGGWFFVFYSAPKIQTVAPGPLNAHHASFGNDCGSCHEIEGGHVAKWAKDSMMGQSGFAQNKMCLDCHDNFDQPHFQRVHSVAEGTLDDLTDGIRQSPRTGDLFRAALSTVTPHPPTNGHGEMACATCHHEHRGGGEDIRELSNRQCQACHAKVFESFSHGHPELGGVTLVGNDVFSWTEFGREMKEKMANADSVSGKIWKQLSADQQKALSDVNHDWSGDLQTRREILKVMNGEIRQKKFDAKGSYRDQRIALQGEFRDQLSPRYNFPHQRRTYVTFNHASHLNGYLQSMAKPDSPKDCLDCHVPSSDGRRMSFKGFQRNCAMCHSAQIVPQSGDKNAGVPLFRIPMVDTLSFEKGGPAIGQYPANAQSDLPAITKLLIAGDKNYPEFAADLRKVAYLPNWEDLSSCTPEELQAVQRIIWGLKRLGQDISNAGRDAFVARLKQATGGQITDDIVEYLVKPLPIATIKTLIQRAYPQVSEEVTSASKGSIPPTRVFLSNADTVDYAILYQPKKHQDNYMQTWLTVIAMSQDASEIFDSSPALYQNFGSCMTCHSAEKNSKGTVILNWHALNPDPTERKLTHFAHGPHMTMDCRHCHEISAQVDMDHFKRSYRNVEPRFFEPVFKPIDKATCVKCHVPQVAGDSCLLCHNYHVGHFEQRTPRTKHSDAMQATTK